MSHRMPRLWIALTVIFLSAMIPLVAEAGVLRLKFSIYLPPTHEQTKLAIEWAKEVEKKTYGRVKIEPYPGGVLTSAQECYDGVVRGISDLGFSVFAYTPGKFSVMAAVDLPMGYPNGKVASRVAHKFAKFLKPEELKAVKVLYLHAPGPAILHTKQPVKRLEDVKGMKIRAYGVGNKVVSALGGAPTYMQPQEVYHALQAGVIDGIEAPTRFLKGWKLAEVSQYTTDSSIVGYTSTNFVIMNKKKWNALPSDVQDVMEKLSECWVDKHGAEWDRMDEEGWKYKPGHKKITLSKDEALRWRKAVEPIIRNYIKSTSNGFKYVNKIEGLMINAYTAVQCPDGYYPCDTDECCEAIRNKY